MSLYGAIDKKYCGSQTVTAADVSQGFIRIRTGFPNAKFLDVTIRRDALFGPVTEGDAVCNYTVTTGDFSVADGASTYTLTDGDIVYWMVIPQDERV